MGMIAIVFGVIFLLAGAGLNLFWLFDRFKTKLINKDFKKELTNYLILLVLCLVVGLGAFLIIFGSNEGYEFNALQLTLLCIASILFFSGLLFFIDNFVIKYYKKIKSDLFKKINSIVFYSLIVFDFIFLCIMLTNSPLSYPLISGFSIDSTGIHWTKPGEAREGFHIQFYAIFILCGAVLVFLMSNHRMYLKYGKKDMLTSTFFVAFPMGIVGARLWYCYVLEFDKFATDFLAVLRIWDGGLAIMGGALLGIISGVLWVIFVRKDIKILDAIDMIVPTILIAQAIGRWGNFFNEEVYGYQVIDYNAPWAWIFPGFIRNQLGHLEGITNPFTQEVLSTEQGVSFALPLCYVEFLSNLTGYFIIRYLFENKLITKGISQLTYNISTLFKPISYETKQKIANAFPVGGCAGLYLIWYGFTRVILEPLRSSKDYFANSEYSSWVLIGLGLGLIVILVIYEQLLKDKLPKLSARLYYDKEKDYKPALANDLSSSTSKAERSNIYNNINFDIEDENKNKKVNETYSLDDINDEFLADNNKKNDKKK